MRVFCFYLSFGHGVAFASLTLFMILGTFFEPRGSIFEVSGRLGRPFHSPKLTGVIFFNCFQLLAPF